MTASASVRVSMARRNTAKRRPWSSTNVRCSPWTTLRRCLRRSTSPMFKGSSGRRPQPTASDWGRRPFADLTSYLQTTDAKSDTGLPLGEALARLINRSAPSRARTKHRTRFGLPWFTSGDATRRCRSGSQRSETGRPFNDLDLFFWNTPDELGGAALARRSRSTLGLRKRVMSPASMRRSASTSAAGFP